MTAPNANKPRYLKITSCAECDKKISLDFYETYACREMDYSKKKNDIGIYVHSKTIHPDCPLPKLDAMIQPIVDVWEEVKELTARKNREYITVIVLSHKIVKAIRETIKLNGGKV